MRPIPVISNSVGLRNLDTAVQCRDNVYILPTMHNPSVETRHGILFWVQRIWATVGLSRCTAVLNIVLCSQIARIMGPTWGPPGSCWPHVGPMNLAICVVLCYNSTWLYWWQCGWTLLMSESDSECAWAVDRWPLLSDVIYIGVQEDCWKTTDEINHPNTTLRHDNALILYKYGPTHSAVSLRPKCGILTKFSSLAEQEDEDGRILISGEVSVNSLKITSVVVKDIHSNLGYYM